MQARPVLTRFEQTIYQNKTAQTAKPQTAFA